MKSQGALQCFCDSDFILDYEREHDDVTYSYIDDNGNAVPELPICEEYQWAYLKAYGINTSLGYIITTVNYVIRTAIIYFITKIGFKTETQLLTSITMFTFLAQFFNTAFLFTIVNANMEEQTPFSFGINSGSYTDFNSMWYKSVGNIIVDAMIFNAWFPLLEIVVYWFLYRFLYR